MGLFNRRRGGQKGGRAPGAQATDTSRISPTAHYTSFVWYRHGLSHPALATALGRTLYHALRPMNAASSLVTGGLTLERMLLQRHRLIDHLLERHIEAGDVTQVVEIACGLSPRGFRMARRYGQRGLRVVEGDLPEMADRKRALLEGAGLLQDNHVVVSLNALHDTGPDSLGAVAERCLEPDAGTAIVTEGLLNYFDETAVIGMWERFARFLQDLGGGVYLADLLLESERPTDLLSSAFKAGLDAFTRGKTHWHFDDEAQGRGTLLQLGFRTVELHRPALFRDQIDIPVMPRGDVVRVIEAVV